jgi:hypothetical protein
MEGLLPFTMKTALLPFEENVCHLYGRTIAVYYENAHERQTWKMEQNKKNIWHTFHFGKIAGKLML